MKIAVCTLGCRTNQFECQAMEKILHGFGHEIVTAEEDADAYIVNSCTVTATADKKTRQLIRHLKRLHPTSLVAVCGCMVQIGEVNAWECGADLVGGNRNFQEFAEAVNEALISRSLPNTTIADETCGFQILPAGGLSGRTRALLKIEDGCQNYCTYCIIPYARGPIRSLPPEEAVAQAKLLCDEGFREIILTGIEVSAYGTDLPNGITLAELIVRIAEAVPDVRISIGSLKPTVIVEDFCRKVSSLPNFCRHFHLSMQSGCTATLARMHRHYTADDICDTVARLRRWFDDPNITADIITGFPGETEAEFEETLTTLRNCRLGDAHIFPYSIRKGTLAAKMDGQLTIAVKKARCTTCIELCAETRNEYLHRQLGTVQTVLMEEGRDGVPGGYTDHYLYVTVPGAEAALKGSFVQVRITDVSGDHLTAEWITA